MNKSFLLFVLFGLAASNLFAQQGVKIGLRFSPIVSFANITDSSNNRVSDDVGTRVGLSYGLMVNYGLTDNFGIQSGIHIVSKGYNRSGVANLDTSGTVNFSQKVSMTTVEIPIALRGRSPEIGNGIFITGVFGISADISAGYKNEFEGIDPITGAASAEGGTKSGSEFLTPVNLTFIFGPGVELEYDWGLINAGVIYHQGLSNMNNRSNIGNQETIRMNYVSLDLAYFF